MRIGIDCRTLTRPHTGVAVYLQNLLCHLSALDSQNEFLLFFDTSHYPDLSLSEAFRYVTLPLPFVRQRAGGNLMAPFWLNLALPPALRREGVDVLFCPNLLAPLWSQGTTVLFVHDLAPYALEKSHPRLWRYYFRFHFPRSVRQAACIITPSNSAKVDLIRHLNIPSNKIHVIHHGINPQFNRINDKAILAQFEAKWQLRTPFILYVGQLTARKNITTLVSAFSQFLSNGHSGYRLVLRGEQAWGYDLIQRSLREENVKHAVQVASYVPFRDLPILYSVAEMLVLPSLYEGFGFPVVEAMACGTPVIASNVSSLPEVVGDAGILVNPMDVQGWANAMESLSQDDHLRQTLVQKGLERAKTFDWHETALQTLQVLTSAGNNDV